MEPGTMHLAQMLDRNVVCCDRSGTIAIEHLKMNDRNDTNRYHTIYTTNEPTNTGPSSKIVLY